MKLSELQPRQGKVDIEVTISELQPPRPFNKMGASGQVCNAKITDGSATMTLTLWNDDCGKYQVGDKLKITNGYVSEWQGELQLGAGKFGKVEKI
jgi:replication factor A1